MELVEALKCLKHLHQVQSSILNSVGALTLTWRGREPIIEGIVSIPLERIVSCNTESFNDMLADTLVHSNMLDDIEDRVVGVTEDYNLLILVTGNAKNLDKEDIESLMKLSAPTEEGVSKVSHPHVQRWVVELKATDDDSDESVSGFETDNIDHLEEYLIGLFDNNDGVLHMQDRYGPKRYLYSLADIAYAISELRAQPKKRMMLSIEVQSTQTDDHVRQHNAEVTLSEAREVLNALY